MEQMNKTGAFRESAQRQNDEACVAFSAAQNLADIERKTGLKKLKDKLNPSQAHKLSIVDLKVITKVSGDYTIINSMLLSLDRVAVPVNCQGDDATLVKHALTASQHVGKIASLTLENSGENRLPRRKAQQLLDACYAGIGSMALLANDLENRTTGITPFLSMTADFVITNGVPGVIG